MAMFSNPSMFGTSLFGSATGDPEKHAQLLALITEGRSSYEIATACQGVKAATINLVPKDGVAPPLLHAAAAANAADSVQALLTAKADVNLGDTSGATALFIAAKNDAVNVLEKLMVVPHVDLNKPRKSGATPVYVATQNNALGCLRALLDAGADPDASKEGGFTPSSVACLRGNDECLSLLVEAGASVDRASSVADRFTPLHLAANGGLDSILKILLEAGASIRLRDSQGKTAKELSKAAGHTVCTAMLTAAEGGERREEVLAQQEQLVQDLRQMPPVRATPPPHPPDTPHASIHLHAAARAVCAPPFVPAPPRPRLASSPLPVFGRGRTLTAVRRVLPSRFARRSRCPPQRSRRSVQRSHP